MSSVDHGYVPSPAAFETSQAQIRFVFARCVPSLVIGACATRSSGVSVYSLTNSFAAAIFLPNSFFRTGENHALTVSSMILAALSPWVQ